MERIFSRRLPSPAEVVGRSVKEILPDLLSRCYEAQIRVLVGEEAADRAAAASNITSLFLRPRTFSAESAT
jgi:hypothetical protein